MMFVPKIGTKLLAFSLLHPRQGTVSGVGLHGKIAVEQVDVPRYLTITDYLGT